MVPNGDKRKNRVGAPPPMGGEREAREEVDNPKSLAYSSPVSVQPMGGSTYKTLGNDEWIKIHVKYVVNVK